MARNKHDRHILNPRRHPKKMFALAVTMLALASCENGTLQPHDLTTSQALVNLDNNTQPARTKIKSEIKALELTHQGKKLTPSLAVPPSVNLPPSPSVSPSPVVRSAAECIAQIPLSRRIGAVLMPAIDASSISDTKRSSSPIVAAIGQNMISSVILMTAPTPGDAAAADDIKQFKANMTMPATIATDVEGGDGHNGGVNRFSSYFTIPTAEAMGAMISKSQKDGTKYVHDSFAAAGTKLKNLGIDRVFGPVADVGPASGAHGPLGVRAFGSTVSTVVNGVTASKSGWADGGIATTEKHFPGIDEAGANTDLARTSTPPLQSLENRELQVYAQTTSAGESIMVSNAVVPGLTNGKPSSLSPAAYQLARKYVGVNGILYTDGLLVPSVNLPVGQAVTSALIAGADGALFVNTYDAAGAATINAAAAAVSAAVKSGAYPEAQLNSSVQRVYAAAHFDPCSLG